MISFQENNVDEIELFQCLAERFETYRGGGSPQSNAYLWAKPKVYVFKNGQFRDPFFLRKILFF